jgi:hypothetical protein
MWAAPGDGLHRQAWPAAAAPAIGTDGASSTIMVSTWRGWPQLQHVDSTKAMACTSSLANGSGADRLHAWRQLD